MIIRCRKALRVERNMKRTKERRTARLGAFLLVLILSCEVLMPATAFGGWGGWGDWGDWGDGITHGTAEEWITEDMLNNTPPADYEINESVQGEAENGQYNAYFLKDSIQTVRITMDENNLNYLLQNALDEPYVMTDSVTIGDTTLGYCGLKTKGAYTLEHAYTDNPGSDRFSFTVNFGKYIDKTGYGSKQNFYGCSKISFNNFFFDKSMMKEFCALMLMKEMGLPTPQFGLAKLYINDQYYGVYAMVETFDESILEQYYHVDKSQLSSYLCKPEGTLFDYYDILEDDSPLWESDEETLVDVADMLPTVKEWVRKLNCLSDGTDFEGNAIDYNSEEYLTLLNEILDVDEVLRYFAAHSWLCQLDNMFVGQKNFGLYVDANGKALLIPWDYDLSFGCYYPSTAQLTANYDIDALYMLGNWGQDISNFEVRENSYEDYPLFNVIFKNEQLMETYHQYMMDCSKIAALGGTTKATGRSYDPGYIGSYITALEEEIITAASEELADNVYYMNGANQPRDVERALPNLSRIISLRAVGVLLQVSGSESVVSAVGCDLSTLGNGASGDNASRGKLTLLHSGTGIYVSGEFAGGGSRNSLLLVIKEMVEGDKDYGSVRSAVGAAASDIVDIYSMNLNTGATGDYTITIPLTMEQMANRDNLRIYFYYDGEATLLVPTANDNLYEVTVADLGIIVVKQGTGENTKNPIPLGGWIAVIGGAVAVVAGVAVFAVRKKKGSVKKAEQE